MVSASVGRPSRKGHFFGSPGIKKISPTRGEWIRFLIDSAARSATACPFAFDILEAAGNDLRELQLSDRKEVLGRQARRGGVPARVFERLGEGQDDAWETRRS
jgi:hypothetical protein